MLPGRSLAATRRLPERLSRAHLQTVEIDDRHELLALSN
jgi:hypothetical protein